VTAFRYGLIGAGMVANVFHRAAAASGGTLEIAAVLARSGAARDRVAAAHGVPVCGSLAELLAARPEAVLLATPPDARAEIVAACAAAGVPVLTEKPLERGTEAAARLVAVMANVPFGVVLQHRMRPASQAAKALLDSGSPGAPRLLRVDVPWWRDASYYAAPGRGSYARDGGGVLLTQAIHALDLGLWLAGGAVTRVQGQTFRALHDLEAEDTAVAGLSFDSGAAGVVTATTAAFPGRPESVEIVCDAATLRLTSGTLTVLYRDGRTNSVGAEGGTGSGADPMAFPHDWHLAVMTDFAEAVRTGRPPAIPAASALPVHRVIEAIAASAREGRAVHIKGGPP
jgi:predicted dehydrogenase